MRKKHLEGLKVVASREKSDKLGTLCCCFVTIILLARHSFLNHTYVLLWKKLKKKFKSHKTQETFMVQNLFWSLRHLLLVFLKWFFPSEYIYSRSHGLSVQAFSIWCILYLLPRLWTCEGSSRDLRLPQILDFSPANAGRHFLAPIRKYAIQSSLYSFLNTYKGLLVCRGHALVGWSSICISFLFFFNIFTGV